MGMMVSYHIQPQPDRDDLTVGSLGWTGTPAGSGVSNLACDVVTV
jgi:hypothetical protein